MKRTIYLIYGVLCYFAFFGTFLYLIGFVEGAFVPKGIDDGVAAPFGQALLINALLVALLGVQHSTMARPGFKKWWTQIVPKPIERSTYVLITSALFCLIFWQWRPITDVVWYVEHSTARTTLIAISLLGWAMVLYASFLIDHFDLFGLRQVWLYYTGRPYVHPSFKRPLLYRFVRNPLMLGFLIAFWCTPNMTGGHLLFCVLFTTYILVGVSLEERDLERLLGEDYRRFRAQTPMLLPWPRKQSAAESQSSATAD